MLKQKNKANKIQTSTAADLIVVLAPFNQGGLGKHQLSGNRIPLLTKAISSNTH